MTAQKKNKTQREKTTHARRKKHSKREGEEEEEGDFFVIAQKKDAPLMWGEVETGRRSTRRKKARK